MFGRSMLPLALIGVSLLAACGSDSGGTPTTPPADVSFATQIQPVFNESCSCHLTAAGPGGLDLRPGQSYGNLVNVFSSNYVGSTRVTPGSPDNSLLWIKVSDVPPAQFGDRMPLGGSLNANDIAAIRAWIEEGAEEN